MAASCAAPPSRKDKNQNIQVFVRLRPINARERDLKSIGVVEVAGSKEIVVRHAAPENKLTKKFTFDRAFGPASKQVDVYQEVVSPLIEEVLAGYNCTVFAYGQTGTGKTHTMVGESSNDDMPWQNDPMAGIIPRSLSQLFDELRITNSEYTVRVSYLELYNEELFDLLSPTEDYSKLRIYEDATRKGANIVHGLEEMTVYNKNEVYKIMAKGQEKRRMASTLMNAQSSRSHTVFTIVVHMKENSPDGEELMKIGKLNLVDLAGSENISKAGTDNPSRKERARECVNINQSLLTLGRVITALVERHPHIPYRESKLTRILQESLGGRTKTSIIATISPGHRDVEETLSTLEYAHRAKNIQNKPEINQKLTKKAVLKEYSEEIDRLKRDLQASREKNGVYLAGETYAEMTLKLEEQEKEIQEQILYIKAIKEEKDKVEALFGEMSDNLKETEAKLDETSKTLNNTKLTLRDKQEELRETKYEVEDQKHLVSTQAETEKKLSEQAKSLLNVAGVTTNDVSLLHNTLDKKRQLESTNLHSTKSFGAKSQSEREKIREYMNRFSESNMSLFCSFYENFDSQYKKILDHENSNKEIINNMFDTIVKTMSSAEAIKASSIEKNDINNTTEFKSLKDDNQKIYLDIHGKMNSLMSLVKRLEDAREKDRRDMEMMKQFIDQWKNASKAKMLNLRHHQSELWNIIDENMRLIREQQTTNSANNLRHLENMSALRKHKDQEITLELNKLKSFITSIEEMHSSSRMELDNTERTNVKSITTDLNSFAELIDNGAKIIEDKSKHVENGVTVFDETMKSFSRDISVHFEKCNERNLTEDEIDRELKSAVNEVSELNSHNWNRCSEKIDLVHSSIGQMSKNIINDQHEFHKSFLQRCYSESHKIIPPMNSIIDDVEKNVVKQESDFRNYKQSIHSFKMETEESLEAYSKMENAFLNEEYKLYSPTGKTPVRKEYQYPQDLACTSPHERILTRYRKMRQRNLKNDSLNTDFSPIHTNHIIELDDETPLKRTRGSSKSEMSLNNHNLTTISLTDSPPSFIEPKPVNTSLPMQNTFKSENDIYSLANNKQSKENLNESGNDKKEVMSRLRQPSSLKKVLGSKNN